MLKRIKNGLAAALSILGILLLGIWFYSSRSGPGLISNTERGPDAGDRGPGGVSDPETVLQLRAPGTDWHVGDHFFVEVWVVGQTGIRDAAFILSFDTGILQAFNLGQVDGEVHLMPGLCPEPGTISVNRINNFTGHVEYGVQDASESCMVGRLATFELACVSAGQGAVEVVEAALRETAEVSLDHGSSAISFRCEPNTSSSESGIEGFEAVSTVPGDFRPVDRTPAPESTSEPAPVQVTATHTALPGGEETRAPTLTPASSEGQPLLKLEASSQSTGLTQTVTLLVENAAGLFGADITLHFDPALIQISRLEPGACPAPDLVLQQAYDNEVGKIDYVLTQLNPSPPCNEGEVLKIVFSCIASGAGAFTIAESILSSALGEAIGHERMALALACSP